MCAMVYLLTMPSGYSAFRTAEYRARNLPLICKLATSPSSQDSCSSMRRRYRLLRRIVFSLVLFPVDDRLCFPVYFHCVFINTNSNSSIKQRAATPVGQGSSTAAKTSRPVVPASVEFNLFVKKLKVGGIEHARSQALHSRCSVSRRLCQVRASVYRCDEVLTVTHSRFVPVITSYLLPDTSSARNHHAVNAHRLVDITHLR